MGSPNEGWVKINADGASRGNLGISSYGFCMRVCMGDVIYSEAKIIGVTCSIIVETLVVLKALQFGKTHHFNNIMLESDSLSIINFLKGDRKIPWEIIDMVESIQYLMIQMVVQLRHIFREDNQIAGFLANLVIEQGSKVHI